MFTLCLDAAERRAFADVLVRATRGPEDPLRVVVTLRDDFLSRLGEVASLRERIAYGQGLQLLGTPSEEDLLRIVTLPAERAGFAFEDQRLPREMVEAVAERPGALALLSFTASRLWAKRDRHFKLLGRRAYEELGGVAGALARHAEETRAAMTHEEQRLVREAFRHLVTAEGTRAVLPRGELEETLGGGPAARTVVDKLVDARLLVATEGAGPPEVEIIHEALLTAWPRLVDWRREDAEGARLRDQLRAAARQWDERGRPKGLLWRDEALAELVRWRARFPGSLAAVEDAFRAASEADAARGVRRRRLLIGGIIAGLSVGLVVTITLARRASEAQGQAERGLVRQYQEQGRQLLLAGDATRAYPYLVEAHRRGGSNPALAFLLGRAGRMLDRQLLSLRHGGPVNDAAYTPDGRLVISASDDKTARIWNAATGQLLHTLPHDDKVYTFALSPDGTKVATASYDRTVAIWEIATGRQLARLTGHADQVRGVAWSPDGSKLASGSLDQTVRVWDAATGTQLMKLVGHTARVRSVSFTPDGRQILSEGREPAPRLWDATTGAPVPLAVQHDDVILAHDLRGDWMATGSRGLTILIFRPGEPAHALLGHLGSVRSVRFSADGGRLVSAAADNSARIWSVPSGDRVIPLVGHRGYVEYADFDAKGTRVVTGSDDATVRVWDATDGRPLAVLDGHTDMVYRARFSPDGKRVISAGFDGMVKIWNPDSGEIGFRVPAHAEGAARAIVVRDDGNEIATVGTDGARLWSLPGLERVTDLPLGEAGLAVSYDERGTLQIVGERHWFTREGQALRSAALPEAAAPAVRAVARDGRLLVGREDGSVLEWRADSAAAPVARPGHKGEVVSLDLLPDGVVSTGVDGVVTVTRRGISVSVSHAYNAQVARVIAAPGGEQFLTAGYDRIAVLWTTENGQRVRAFEGHTNIVADAVFSRDGQFVATASHDGSARVWDATTAELLMAIPSDQLDLVAFDPQGRYLVAVGAAGALTRWDIRSESRSTVELERNLACRVPFTLAEGVLVPHETRCGPRDEHSSP
jgi:WD40 repeat protein